ncbi:uncharacterized protein LOC110990712 [Acanthaster planci]|uniref:Uncharacterized protein LOC110990712 n=1 Tax=Acanthaster planci TaxID=133434 RepID=A0A8B8A694_ACAPL|nr:uncharacterized protein LOC110990712 [Acanthaster planci]
MEDDINKDLVINEIPCPTTDPPPPYNPNVRDQGNPQQQYSQPYYEQQHPPIMQQPIYCSPPAQGANEMFAREECFAHCIRVWWCRPIGWLAVAQLEKAKTLYLAGDYNGAQEAAKRANMWSAIGLITGVLLVAGVAVATYFIVTSVMGSD